MLRTVPGFDQLASTSLSASPRSAILPKPRPGEVLFREGTLPESLYVLLDGRVSLTGTAADASSTVIDILGPASSFVLANVLTDEPYLMGARGDRRIRGWSRIGGRTDAADRGVAQPAAAMAMMRAMSAELGNMTRQVVDLKVRIAAQRLGTYLLSQVERTDRARRPSSVCR